MFFSDEFKKQIIWQKAKPIISMDENEWRYDFQNRIIRYSEYGNRNSKYGWEFGHIHDRRLGGSDSFNNLRPQHWQSNASDGGILAALLKGTESRLF
jgi:hypothetical protein